MEEVGSVSLAIKVLKKQLMADVKSSIKDAAKEAKSEAKSMGKAISDGMHGATGAVTGLTSAFKKLLGVLGIGISIASLIKFGKECVDLGSDLSEVQNVVDVTFGDMSDRVNEFAQSSIKSYGISETAAKNYMGTLGAMSQAFGFSQAEAYDQAEELTALAGDMASFYNKTTDETFNALRSVYSGETEVLKQYGVVMTETALNEFALARGMGKTVSQMSEQEKVSLRLAFVQDKLAMASGDFARTQGSWANQTRVLSLQWASFKATIGQGLINVLTPVVQWLNAIMEAAQGAAQAFADFTATIMGVTPDLGGVADATAAAAQSSQDINSGISSAGGAAKKAVKQLAGFDKLNILSKQSSGGGGGGKSSSVSPTTIDKATQSENALNNTLSRTRELLSEIGDAFREGFGATYNGQYIDDIREDISSIGATVRRIFSDPEVRGAAETCTRSWARAFGAVTGTVATITAGVTKTVTGSIDTFLTDNEEPIKEHMITMFDLSSREADAITSISESVSRIFQKVFDSENLEKAGGNILGSIFDVSSVFAEIAQAIPTGFLEGIAESFITFEDDISTACVNVTDAIATFTGQIKEKLDIVRKNFETSGIADKAKAIGDAIGSMVGTIAKGFNKMYPVIKPVLIRIGDFIAKDLSKFVSGLILGVKVVLSVLKAVFNAVKGVVEILMGLTSGDWDMFFQGFKDVFGSVSDLIIDLSDDLADFFYDLGEIFNFDGVVQSIKDAWNGLSSWFSEVVIEPIKGFFSGMSDDVSIVFSDLWLVIVGIWSIVSGWFDENVVQPIINFFEPIKTKVSGFFSELWTNIQGVWNTVSSWFEENVTQPVTAFFEGVWTDVSGFFSSLWDDICAGWENAGTWFEENVIDPIVSAFDSIKASVAEIFNSVLGSVESTINHIIDGLNTFIGVVNDIGQRGAEIAGQNFTGFSEFGHISIPRLANGGFVEANTPQLAVIGDNRHQGEFVAPEDKLQAAVTSAMMAMMPQMAMAMANAVSRANIGAGGEFTIHNHIDLDGDAIYDNQEKVRRRREKRSGGN